MNAVVLAVALPLLGAFLTPSLARLSLPLGRLFGPGLLAFCLWLLWGIARALGDATAGVALGGFAPPLGIAFHLDRLALLFALAVPAMVLALWPWGGRPREWSLTLVLAAAATGLALSGDLFNLYVFYELLAVASYGLIAANQRPAAQAAALRYLLLSAAGSALALLGIALVYTQTGTLNLAQLALLAPVSLDGPLGLAAFALLLLGIGVKAEAFPVNTWVPEVYATAPSRLAGLLAGLVSKLAVLVIVRLLLVVFQRPEATQLMLVLGVLGIAWGELAAWRARDLSRQLAWSSVGQLGIVFVAFSLPGETGVLAGLAVALHHLLVKPALFLLARRWNGALEGLRGAARRAPLAGALFALFALSLVGVPPLPGFWAKFVTLSGLFAQPGPLCSLAAVVILTATLVEAAYLFRTLTLLFGPGGEEPRMAPHGALDLGTATAFAGLLLAGVIWLQPLTGDLHGIARQAVDMDTYVDTDLPTPRP